MTVRESVTNTKRRITILNGIAMVDFVSETGTETVFCTRTALNPTKASLEKSGEAIIPLLPKTVGASIISMTVNPGKRLPLNTLTLGVCDTEKTNRAFNRVGKSLGSAKQGDIYCDIQHQELQKGLSF